MVISIISYHPKLRNLGMIQDMDGYYCLYFKPWRDGAGVGVEGTEAALVIHIELTRTPTTDQLVFINH